MIRNLKNMDGMNCILQLIKYSVINFKQKLQEELKDISLKTEYYIHDLKLACKNFEESFGKDDLTTIAEKDVAFHDIIFRSTKNARLIQILNNLREQMYRYRLEYLKDTQSHDRLVEEHQRIVDAIIDKNKEEAVRLIQEHIYIQELTVIKKLQEQEA